jgi:ATP-dependent Lon protease
MNFDLADPSDETSFDCQPVQLEFTSMTFSGNPDTPFNLMNILDDDTEFIPLLSQEDEASMNKQDIPDTLAILPLRNTVLFPGVVIPITVGRDRSINLIKDAYKGDKIIGVIAQKDVSVEDPGLEDLHRVGTVAHVLKMLRMPDGNTTIIIQGKRRFEIVEQVQTEPYITCKVRALVEYQAAKSDKEFLATVSSLKDLVGCGFRHTQHRKPLFPDQFHLLQHEPGRPA